MLESSERALDRLSLIRKLADALQVAPSELTRVPAPGNGERQLGYGAGAPRLRFPCASGRPC